MDLERGACERVPQIVIGPLMDRAHDPVAVTGLVGAGRMVLELQDQITWPGSLSHVDVGRAAVD